MRNLQIDSKGLIGKEGFQTLVMRCKAQAKTLFTATTQQTDDQTSTHRTQSTSSVVGLYPSHRKCRWTRPEFTIHKLSAVLGLLLACMLKTTKCTHRTGFDNTTVGSSHKRWCMSNKLVQILFWTNRRIARWWGFDRHSTVSFRFISLTNWRRLFWTIKDTKDLAALHLVLKITTTQRTNSE